MATTALERKALVRAAVTLHELTMAEAAGRLGVSYNHLILVLRGDRVGSARLQQAIGELVGRPARELFAPAPGETSATPRRKPRAGPRSARAATPAPPKTSPERDVVPPDES